MLHLTSAMVVRDTGIEIVTIDEALAKPNEPYYCPECGKRLKKPVTAGGNWGAHFEHLERNINCSRSDT